LTGRGHRLMGMGVAAGAAPWVAMTLGGPATMAFCAAALPGSTAPDWLEGRVGGRTLIPHRTITHLPWPWGLALLAGFALVRTDPFAGAALMGFAAGALTHWLGDLGTPMGVPVLRPSRRVSLRLWRTGQGETRLVLAVWILAALAITASQSIWGIAT